MADLRLVNDNGQIKMVIGDHLLEIDETEDEDRHVLDKGVIEINDLWPQVILELEAMEEEVKIESS